MVTLLRRVHIWVLAWFVKYFRTRQLVKAFTSAHEQELRETPVQHWAMVIARQKAEIAGIKAGKLDSAIVERKSWTWPFQPSSIQRLSIPIMKVTPYNMRRMSRTPVPRRAMNLIKGALIALPWEVRAIDGEQPVEGEDEQHLRIDVARKIFAHPNNIDSFQTYIEAGVEDMCVTGSFVAEIGLTVDPQRPIKMWPVMSESMRLFLAWKESTPDLPRYAQMTGLKGERGAILFYDDEVLYIKDNPSTDNPFGLGKMEVAFSAVNSFLGVQEMSGRAGTDQIHKCFPEWTDVLTKRGWIPWRDATDADEFATRNTDGEFQWQRALGFVREWHEGDLIQFRSRNLQMTVTPHHRMYGVPVYRGKKGRAPLGFTPANKLEAAVTNRPGGKQGGKRTKPYNVLKDFRVPATSVWKGYLPTTHFQLGTRKFSWEDWAALLGIWMAEGSCLGSGLPAPPKGEYRVQIAQSKRANGPTYKKIELLLKRLGVHYYAKADRILFTDREIWKYLSPFGDSHSKHVPSWVKDAPTPLIREFIDWAMLGDGTQRSGGKRVYHTVSRQLADDIQELLQKIGSSGVIHPVVQESGLIYRVEEMLRSEISIVPDGGGTRGKQRTPQRIAYSGMVYCAMVPNGTLYCRENGYPFWSGNTFLWWEASQNEAHIQIVRRHIQNELEGQAKLSIIAGMKKPETIEVTPVTEADLLLNWQELLIRMIANAFDMSAMSLGVEHDVNRAVGEVLNDADFRSAVVPMARRLQEAFTRKILHQKLGWADLEFAFLRLDDPDMQTLIDMYQRIYTMNACTPAEIRKAIGLKPLNRPVEDLTQYEAMLLNMEAMSDLQDRNAASAMGRQVSVMQQMQPSPQEQQRQQQNQPPQKGKPPQNGQPPQRGGQQQQQQQQQPGGPGASARLTPGNVARGGQPPSPKPLGLPKFPIASGHTAKEIVQMPINELTDVYRATGMRASQFLQAVDAQEPGILEQLSDEVKQYFQQQIVEEQKARRARVISPKFLNKWQKELAIKVRKNKKRTNDMAQYLSDLGKAGRPGAGSMPTSTAGKPGKMNPPQRL